MKQFERVDTAPGYDEIGKIIHMVASGGYVMVKRPRCVPFVLTLKEWAKIPKGPHSAQFKPEPPSIQFKQADRRTPEVG